MYISTENQINTEDQQHYTTTEPGSPWLLKRYLTDAGIFWLAYAVVLVAAAMALCSLFSN
jgi:hypothetical protein